MQVAYDVAVALESLQGLGVLHCDLSRHNFGKLNGRGVLFDFSAAKVSACTCVIVVARSTVYMLDNTCLRSRSTTFAFGHA